MPQLITCHSASHRVSLSHSRRCGFSLVEILVTLAIIAMLMALILPAVQSSRQAARKIECQSNLRQIGLAVQQYLGTSNCFPPSGNGDEASYLVRLLPFLDQSALYKEFDFSSPVTQQVGFAKKRPALFACPSDGIVVSEINRNSYVGNVGWYEPDSLSPPYLNERLTGVIVFQNDPQFPVRAGNVRDGLSATAVVSEFLSTVEGDSQRAMWLESSISAQVLPGELLAQNCLSATTFSYFWFRGGLWSCGGFRDTLYDHLLPPNRRSCKWVINSGSTHLGGANVTFCDGAVRFVSSSIDSKAWRAAGTKAGHETISIPQ